MKDIVEPQTKNGNETGKVPLKRYTITEPPVRLQTPEGVRRYPARTRFPAFSFIPVVSERLALRGITTRRSQPNAQLAH